MNRIRLPFTRRWRRDPRSDDEIRRDLHDEFTHHLALLVRDERLRSPDDADDAARRAELRFGDPARHARACLHIIREDRSMKNRLLIAIALVTITGLAGTVLLQVSRAHDARREAELARAEAQHMQAFVAEMLTAANPANPSAVDVATLLDAAAARVEHVNDPDVAERVRAAIDEARSAIDAATTSADATSVPE